jgi:hypothetical protein
MFDNTSRYANTETTTLTLEDGTEVSYVRRRFLPGGDSHTIIGQVSTVQRDRMDTVAYRSLGDPLSFWRIADANEAMDPTDLVDKAGRTLVIPMPM